VLESYSKYPFEEDLCSLKLFDKKDSIKRELKVFGIIKKSYNLKQSEKFSKAVTGNKIKKKTKYFVI
jgi:hypothetical protein